MIRNYEKFQKFPEIYFSGLFNLRAADIAYNPFYISYAIVERRNQRTRYMYNI